MLLYLFVNFVFEYLGIFGILSYIKFPLKTPDNVAALSIKEGRN